MGLLENLKKNGQSDIYPYHMPGHKRRLAGSLPQEIIKLDVTEVGDFDNLHHTEGILKEKQEEAAQAYGAEESFYLVNGSSCGILSAISAAVPEGGHILIPRNCHKSVYHGIYQKNLIVSYLYPEIIKEFDICEAIKPKQVQDALESDDTIDAVLIVSPTYEGRIAEVLAIADIVHQYNIPLIVDEAHGAHLGFHPIFAVNSARQGADLVINSIHKTLPALTQSALLHVNGTRINREILKRYLQIYQSSSPSYPLMASIENAIQIMKSQGEELCTSFYENYKKMLMELSQCKHLKFLPMGKKQDIGKLLISVNKTNLSGKQLCDILLVQFGLQMEMATESSVLAMFTVSDGKEAYQRLTKALLELDATLELMECTKEEKAISEIFENKEILIHKNSHLKKAWESGKIFCSLEDACGRCAGEFISLYPPGIPFIVPGEMIQLEQIKIIQHYIELKYELHGIQYIDNQPMLSVI